MIRIKIIQNWKYDASKCVPIFKSLGQKAQNLAMGLSWKFNDRLALHKFKEEHENNKNDFKLK